MMAKTLSAGDLSLPLLLAILPVKLMLGKNVTVKMYQ